MSFLQLENISKTYPGTVPVAVLKKLHLQVEEGEFVSIMGPSGSGKTTLLNLIATLDTPTEGTISLAGQELRQFSPQELALFRRRALGFVFQHYNLLAPLTVAENIMLPLTLDKVPVAEMKAKTAALLTELGITEKSSKRIYELSGGEEQRVAIARALIHEPQLLLADEPTGNLDSKAATDVMRLLSEMNRTHQVTTMMVTHDPYSASYSNRVVFIKDGQFYNELYCGEDRQVFYQQILDVLAHLGGRSDDLQSIDLP